MHPSDNRRGRDGTFREEGDPVRLGPETAVTSKVASFKPTMPSAEARAILRDPAILNIEYFEPQPKTMERLTKKVGVVMEATKRYLGDVQYKYLPPMFDNVLEYDSDDERRKRAAEGDAVSKLESGKVASKKAMGAIMRGMKAMMKAANDKVAALRAEDAKIAREMAALEAEESDFSDWDVPTDYDSEDGGMKRSKRKKKRSILGTGRTDESGGNETSRSEKSARTERSSNQAFAQSVSQFMSVFSKKMETIEKVATARSAQAQGSKPPTERGSAAPSGRRFFSMEGSVEEMVEEGEGGGGGGGGDGAAAAGAGGDGATAEALADGTYGEQAWDASADGQQGYYYENGQWYPGGEAAAVPWTGEGWYDDEGEWHPDEVSADDKAYAAAYESGYGDGSADGSAPYDGSWGGDGAFDATGYGDGAGGDGSYGYEGYDESFDAGVVDADAAPPVDPAGPIDYGSGLKREVDDRRTPDQRRIDASDANAERQLRMYEGKTLPALQKEQEREWIRQAEERLASPYRRPVRMATAPKVGGADTSRQHRVSRSRQHRVSRRSAPVEAACIASRCTALPALSHRTAWRWPWRRSG
jgi:hypothetical protein